MAHLIPAEYVIKGIPSQSHIANSNSYDYNHGGHVPAFGLIVMAVQIEGSWPEWCISNMMYSRDTPFWS